MLTRAKKRWRAEVPGARAALYFNAYVDHLGLRDKITFDTAVEHAERHPDGRWDITLGGGAVRRYDALLVANGHHWDPRWPEPPIAGHFDGTQMHAHAYRDNSMLRGDHEA